MLDVEPEVFMRCMNNNSYSSLLPAQSILKSCVEDDKTVSQPPTPQYRRIIFVNSSASLIPLPGYTAYNCELNVYGEEPQEQA